MAIQDEIFKRSNLLLGDEAMQAVAAIFGFTLAGLVLQDAVEKTAE